MSMRLKDVPTDVQRLQKLFGRWRANKGAGPEPIPPKLWEAAVELCRTHGVSRVSRWLRLQHATLKKRLGRRSSPSSVRPQPQFVEWRLSAERFRFWPTPERGGRTRRLEAHELQVLLACGDPAAAKAPPPWRRVGEAFPAGSTTTVMSPAFPHGQLRP